MAQVSNGSVARSKQRFFMEGVDFNDFSVLTRF